MDKMEERDQKNQVCLFGDCEDDVAVDLYEVSLRQWMDRPERSVDAFECWHIFRQVVEIVNAARSQGSAAHNVRPSCLVMSSNNRVSYTESAFPMKQILLMETNWYTSPEEGGTGASSSCASGICGFWVLLFELFCPYDSREEEKMHLISEEDTGASDIYRLGVLLFELFCPYISREEKIRTMSSLRHRLLPPQLLLKWPKEASFCLWLLHPEPTSRPKIGDLLQSEFLNEPRDDLQKQEAEIELGEKLNEQESLLEFLLSLQQKKQEAADNLQDTVSSLCSDIEEVMKRQPLLEKKAGSYQELGKEEVSTPDVPLTNAIETLAENQENIESSRLMKNFKKLESAYFSTRSSVSDSAARVCYTEGKGNEWINPFLEGLSKYLSFTKLKVKAVLNGGDLLNSSNVVCALSFDRDGEFFASAGVNKKIKVFEYDSVVSEDRDIHYPVVEMASGSKLSSLCWNSYIKSQIASGNYEGIVQVWDVTRSQVLAEMKEHERRIWSIDFSSADPTMLASGSDDSSVKLWSINQGASVGTIKTAANICSVQFNLDSGRFLAFGSADHNVYYYDLRNLKAPLCTFSGHDKAVSYVKFVDAMNLVSASTDNTLKLWDLSSCTSRVIDTPVQSFTGHTNAKNFVGLSVSNGYIATGSETNEVFVYHKAFPMPSLSYNFSDTRDEADSAAHFISSVCWRGHSSTLVAANSSGNIKVLEMV